MNQGFNLLPHAMYEEAIQRSLTNEEQLNEHPHLPRDHPGAEWHFNHPRARHYYQMMIEGEDGNGMCTKYVGYHRSIPYPEINGTMGKDCPIIVENLRLPYKTSGPTRVNQHMTLPQQRIFDPDMQMKADLDKALHQLDDWPLTAEVQFYRQSVEYLEAQHEEARHIRSRIHETMGEIKDSMACLSYGDVYARVMSVLGQEGIMGLWIPNPELRRQMNQVDESTTPPSPLFCTWCQNNSHDVCDCVIFIQCFYCKKFGHRDENCYKPHQYCCEDCLVDQNHARYRHLCRARPYITDDKIQGVHRSQTRERRLERRERRQAGL